MKIRELLRYEIWSKETSRKILRAGWEMPEMDSDCFRNFGFTDLGCIRDRVSLAYERRKRIWKGCLSTNRGVGKAYRLQLRSISADDGKAHDSVGVAAQRAWTTRDHTVAFDLWLYLTEIDQIQSGDRLEAASKLIVQEKHLQWYSNPELEEKRFISLRREELRILRTGLHKELD